MAEKVEFSSKQMLDWMGYIADMLQISPEKIKLLNTLLAKEEMYWQLIVNS